MYPTTRFGSFLGSLFALACLAPAQVQPGDILLNSFLPDGLLHYRPDGTLVQTAYAGTGSNWWGAGLLPDGAWVSVRQKPNGGLNVFDGVTGRETASSDIRGLQRTDLGVRSDGSIIIADHGGKLFHVDAAGTVLHIWPVPGICEFWGVGIDGLDHTWVTDPCVQRIHHLDENGKKLQTILAPGEPGDIVAAPDGTLWISERNGSQVWHCARDGTLLGSFTTALSGGLFNGLGLAPDGTLWVTGVFEVALFHYDQTGTFLGQIDLPPGVHPGFLVVAGDDDVIGVNYCGPANLNSSGQSGIITATGSTEVALNTVTLTASQLPAGKFGYFLNSDVQGFRPLPPGSQGILCLGGATGRHVKQITQSNNAGEIVIQVDLTSLPRPGGTHAVLAGETWNFQCWFRDGNPGPTSNFTDGLSITFD